MTEQIDPAPLPWKIVDHTRDKNRRSGWISIVDADLNTVCDFFPYAAKGGRGHDATMALARQILGWSSIYAASSQPRLAPSDRGESRPADP
jgi:hypothetical protein